MLLLCFQIFDGEYFGIGEDVEQLVSACGTPPSLPSLQFSGNNVMSVGFLSDDAIAGRGFAIEYSLEYGKIMSTFCYETTHQK